MSVKVLRHGDKRRIKNPVTGEWQDVTNVVFTEEGRKGAIDSMSVTTAALTSALGGETQVGLILQRIHTHPIVNSALGEFPVGREFPNLFINRALYSLPQVSQQENVKPRMVEGRPTFFTTSIEESAKDDQDNRLPNEVLARLKPEYFTEARIGVANVQTIVNSEVPPAQFGNKQNLQGGAAGSQQGNPQQQAEPAVAELAEQQGGFEQNPGM